MRQVKDQLDCAVSYIYNFSTLSYNSCKFYDFCILDAVIFLVFEILFISTKHQIIIL